MNRKLYRTLCVALLLLSRCVAKDPTAREYDEEGQKKYETANQYFEQRQYDQAIPLYREVIQVRNLWKEPYTQLALCYERTGHFQEALEVYEKYQRVEHNDVENMKNLLRLYEKLGMSEKAAETRQRLDALSSRGEHKGGY